MLVFWKSLVKLLILFGVVNATVGCTKAVRSVKKGPQYFFSGALFMGCLETSFAAMILLTTAARAFLFYSLNPLFSAIIGRFILGDELKTRTIVALIFATASVFLTFAPGFIGNDAEAGASAAGDMCGVAAGICQSAYICLVRYVHRRDPEITLVPSAASGSLTAMLAAASVTLITERELLPDGDSSIKFFCAVAASGVCVAILLVCLSIAPRTLSGAEVSLITLLETPLGPFFVFLWFGETPGPWTLAGGALLFSTLVLHEAAGMRDRQGDEDMAHLIGHVSEGMTAKDDEPKEVNHEIELPTSICTVAKSRQLVVPEV
jgi:drug/metabolite transporter (DMT)-like permease